MDASRVHVAEPTIEPPLDRRAVLLRGVGVILIGSVLFGIMAVCVRVAAREMPSSQITFVRFSGAFLVLLALSRGRGLRPRASNLPRILLRGLFGAVAAQLKADSLRATRKLPTRTVRMGFNCADSSASSTLEVVHS